MCNVIVAAGVYPRVCGETMPCDGKALAAGGLSPRVRGNLAEDV